MVTVLNLTFELHAKQSALASDFWCLRVTAKTGKDLDGRVWEWEYFREGKCGREFTAAVGCKREQVSLPMQVST